MYQVGRFPYRNKRCIGAQFIKDNINDFNLQFYRHCFSRPAEEAEAERQRIHHQSFSAVAECFHYYQQPHTLLRDVYNLQKGVSCQMLSDKVTQDFDF